jgi:hypothetical protein
VEPATDCDWMALQASTLFRHDSRGRITERREPGRPPAPRFFLGRTPHGNVWRLRADLPSDLVRGLSRLAGREPALAVAGGAPPPPERAEAIRRLLDEAGPIDHVWRGPAYRFPGDADQPGRLAALAAGVERIDASDGAARAALAGAFTTLEGVLEERLPCFGVREREREGGGADEDAAWASVAYTAAGLGGPALEVGVETAPGQRGRGLAGRCVAAWALDVMRQGVEPLYSASWTNSASIAVARKLGLVLYGEDLQWS